MIRKGDSPTREALGTQLKSPHLHRSLKTASPAGMTVESSPGPEWYRIGIPDVESPALQAEVRQRETFMKFKRSILVLCLPQPILALCLSQPILEPVSVVLFMKDSDLFPFENHRFMHQTYEKRTFCAVGASEKIAIFWVPGVPIPYRTPPGVGGSPADYKYLSQFAKKP